jgi:hypothetical protein
MFGVRLSLFPVVCLAVLAASTPQHAQDVAVAELKSGIIVEQSNAAPRVLAMEQSMDVKMTGVGKAVLTQGFSSPKQVATHSGARAAVVLTDAQPTFLFLPVSSSAEVAELADAQASGACCRKAVEVRVLSSAPAFAQPQLAGPSVELRLASPTLTCGGCPAVAMGGRGRAGPLRRRTTIQAT